MPVRGTWQSRKHWPRICPERPWPDWLDAGRFPAAYPDRVRLIDGGVETAVVEDCFDIVCSFQVAEHVSDVGAFARVNKAVLARSGTAVHRVDFGPHDWAGMGNLLRSFDSPTGSGERWDRSGARLIECVSMDCWSASRPPNSMWRSCKQYVAACRIYAWPITYC